MNINNLFNRGDRELKRLKLQNLYDPDYSGEEIPDFFTPSRIKLFFTMIQDVRNNNRINRKPIPKKIKKEIEEKCIEYAEYRTYQDYYMEDQKQRKE